MEQLLGLCHVYPAAEVHGSQRYGADRGTIRAAEPCAVSWVVIHLTAAFYMDTVP